MKKSIFAATLLVVSACSSAKYSANFRPQRSMQQYTMTTGTMSAELTPVQQATLVASVSPEVIPVTEITSHEKVTSTTVRKTYIQMSKGERKNLRRQLRTEFRKYINPSKDNSTPAGEWGRWDQDLKYAAIFGAIGTTGLIIGAEPFFVIGAIALIIGVVFLVRWLVRQ